MADGPPTGTVPRMPTQLLDRMRELDSRTNDGIHVRMLWSEHDGRVAVAVSDAKTGEAFDVEVRESDRALDASDMASAGSVGSTS